jgi:elongation factor G
MALLFLDMTPFTPAGRGKLARGLEVLAAENAFLEVRPGAEPDGTVIGAATEGQLEEIVDRLKREFEVEARVGRPTVAYLETVTRTAEGRARHVCTAAGHGEYVHLSLRLHPGAAGSGYRFEDATIGGSIPKRFMTSIDSGIGESVAKGVLRGYPIVDIRVEVHDGSYHDANSTDAAFKTAAALAFQEAAKKAEPVVLEPVMQVVVRTDERHAKSVLDNLRMRRGEIQARTHEPDQDDITARVPLSELFGFEGQLRADTYGHTSCSIRFAGYQPMVQGPARDDDHTSHVGAPRRPAPDLRSSAASVREPNDSNAEA